MGGSIGILAVEREGRELGGGSLEGHLAPLEVQVMLACGPQLLNYNHVILSLVAAGTGKSRSEQAGYGIPVNVLSPAPSEHLGTGRIRRGYRKGQSYRD